MITASESMTGKKFELTVDQNAAVAQRDLLGKYAVRTIEILESYLDTNGFLNREHDFLKNLGKIPKSSDWNTVKKCFDAKIFQEIVSDPKKYQLTESDYFTE